LFSSVIAPWQSTQRSVGYHSYVTMACVSNIGNLCYSSRLLGEWSPIILAQISSPPGSLLRLLAGLRPKVSSPDYESAQHTQQAAGDNPVGLASPDHRKCLWAHKARSKRKDPLVKSMKHNGHVLPTRDRVPVSPVFVPNKSRLPLLAITSFCQ